MKNYYFILLLSIYTLHSYAQINHADYAFKPIQPGLSGLLLKQYPNMDSNKNGVLEKKEVEGYSFPDNTFTLDLTHYSNPDPNFPVGTHHIDLTSIQYFNVHSYKFVNKIFSPNRRIVGTFDLTRRGIYTSCAPSSCIKSKAIESFHVENVKLSLNFKATGVKVKHFTFLNCETDGLDLTKLSQLPSPGDLKTLTIDNSGSYSDTSLTFNLSNFTGLEKLSISRITMEKLRLGAYHTAAGNPVLSSLNHLVLSNIDGLKTVELPASKNPTTLSPRFHALKTLILYNIPTLQTIDLSKEKGLQTLAIESLPKLASVDVSKLIYFLKTIKIYQTGIQKLQLPGLSSNLKTLELGENQQLLELDLSDSYQLERLKLFESMIEDINIIKNQQLKWVQVVKNPANFSVKNFYAGMHPKLDSLHIEAIDLKAIIDNRNMPNLSYLNIKENKFKFLDISQHPKLKTLIASGNLLTEIDLSKNPMLETLIVDHNDITKIDITKTKVTKLVAHKNKLRSLKLANGLNHLIKAGKDNSPVFSEGPGFYIHDETKRAIIVSGNPDLRCILVDPTVAHNTINDTDYWIKDPTALFTIAEDKIVFTNTELKKQLLNITPSIDADKNGELSSCELASYTKTIVLSNLTLTHEDVKILEKFIRIKELLCRRTQITKIDLTKFPLLTNLNLNHNNITSVDLSKNTALKRIELGHNLLTKIDVSKNKDLEHLELSDNKITAIDLSKNTALKVLQIRINLLTALDISKNTKIEYLNCSYNKLTHLPTKTNLYLKSLNCSDNVIQWLDLSSNHRLEYLTCNDNSFTAATVVATELKLDTNTALIELNCSRTQITTLDISKLSKLKSLTARSNPFKKINIANKNNSNLFIDITTNPTLKCVQVDNAIVNNIPSSWQYDSSVIFNHDGSCQPLSTEDFSLKKSFTIVPNPTQDRIRIQNTSLFTIQHMYITDLTGKRVSTNQRNTTMNVSHLSKGMYMLHILLDNRQKVIKKILKL